MITRADKTDGRITATQARRRSRPQSFWRMLWASTLIISTVSIISTTRSVLAQDPYSEALLEQMAEDAPAGEFTAEVLARLKENPMDVNNASAEDFAGLPHLSPRLARAIVAHRTREGPFQKVNELAHVAGFDAALLRALRPYVTIAAHNRIGHDPTVHNQAAHDRSFLDPLKGSVMQRVGRRIELGKGYQGEAPVYAGSPYRIYTRVRAAYGERVHGGFSLEKDPGESFRWSPGNGALGYDHLSGYLAWEGDGWLSRLVIGNFGVEYGQGLLLWSGVSFGKGAAAVHPLLRSGAGIGGVTSSRESASFRGIGAAIQPSRRLQLTAFASDRKRDASLSESGRIRSLVADGMHRTASEIARRRSVRERIAGGAVTWHMPYWTVGLAGYGSQMSTAYELAGRPDQFFDAGKPTAHGVSLFGSASLGTNFLFFELTRDARGRPGGVGGLHVGGGRAADVLISFRHYPADFRSPYGSAFSEGSGKPENESGIYAGVRLQLHPQWVAVMYADYYRFPYLRFQVPGPSGGLDTRLILRYRPRDWLNASLQLRSETRDVPEKYLSTNKRVLDGLGRSVRQGARLQGSYHFTDDIRLRSRVSLSRYRKPPGRTQLGLLLYHQVRWQALPWLMFYGRLSYFDVESYDARLYSYENDLLYRFSVPAFQHAGHRYFVMMRAAVGRQATVAVKWSATRYDDLDQLGSGWETINGSVLREIYLQVRYRL